MIVKTFALLMIEVDPLLVIGKLLLDLFLSYSSLTRFCAAFQKFLPDVVGSPALLCLESLSNASYVEVEIGCLELVRDYEYRLFESLWQDK